MPQSSRKTRFFATLFFVLVALLLAESLLLWLDRVRGDGSGVVAGFSVSRLFGTLRWVVVGVGLLAAGIRSRSNAVQNLTLGLFTTVLIVGLLELVCGWLLKKQAATFPKIAGPVHSMQPDPYLGYKPRPDTALTGVRTKDGRVIYRIQFQTDSNSLRVTPAKTQIAPNKYALFFGCSMTFGEGVQSNETLPYYFTKADSTYRPYNLAYSGYGPQQMLSRLQHNSPRRFVSEAQGVAFYTYIPDHVNRAIQSLTNYEYNRGNAPYYYPDGDSLRYGGLFRDSRKFRNWVYEVMGRSNLLKFFRISYPFRLSDRDYDLTAEVMAKSAAEYRRQFGNDRFYVIIYPTTLPQEEIVSRLKAKGVKVLDYSKLFNPLQKGYSIPDDEHPTPLANQVLVAQLRKDLQKY
ncbi:MAG: hypothetical protein LH606_03690 [Cytophagaceae bacterium]|nr:hypothetical protein [Cytophagaceae bacterium]